MDPIIPVIDPCLMFKEQLDTARGLQNILLISQLLKCEDLHPLFSF